MRCWLPVLYLNILIVLEANFLLELPRCTPVHLGMRIRLADFSGRPVQRDEYKREWGRVAKRNEQSEQLLRSSECLFGPYELSVSVRSLKMYPVFGKSSAQPFHGTPSVRRNKLPKTVLCHS